MTPATPADAPAITAFLQAHAATSMFPLSNLLRDGMGGDAPRAMRFWLAGDPPTGLLGVTQDGMVLPQMPALPQGLDRAHAILRDIPVMGLIGAAPQVAALRGLPGLADAPTLLDEVEPLFTLALADLIAPDCTGCRLIPLDQAPCDLLIAWRAQAAVESLGQPQDTAQSRAAAEIAAWIAADTHRVLLRDGVPVAMTGFNAQVPGAVQVGAVFTPPPLRGQGHARRAVALHLEEARTRGVTRASLFAANDQAARAYRAIGFRQIGQMTLTLFAGPQQVRHG